MGQATSKRRSYTPGADKTVDSETVKPTRANGDLKPSGVANGSIEVRTSDSGQIEADETTTPTSVTSDSSTGRKETKRRRFRVSGLFSLKRTPSGKWPRRRKTTAASMNGTRPVSCPDPHKDAVASPARPQSLFLEELEIQEDDSKIETVDLSDHEQDGKSKQKAGKSSAGAAPKPPEKTKGRRGSKKQSSLKKKKQEKKNSKKDKKTKTKQKTAAEETAGAVGGDSADLEVPSSPEIKDHEQGKPEKVNDVETAAEELISSLESNEERENASTALDLTQQVMAHIDSKAHVEKEESKEIPKQDIEAEEEDLDAVASSIVAETMNIAQKRLGEEKIRNNDEIEIVPNGHHIEDEGEISGSVKDSNEITASEQKDIAVEQVSKSVAEVFETSPSSVAEEFFSSTLISQESSPTPQAPPRNRHSATLLPEMQNASRCATENKVTLPLETSGIVETAKMTEQSDNPTFDSPVVEECAKVVKAETEEHLEEKIQELMPQAAAGSKLMAAASPFMENKDAETVAAEQQEVESKDFSNLSLPAEHYNEVPVDVGEEIAAVSASVVALHSEQLTNGTEGEITQANTEEKKTKVAPTLSKGDEQVTDNEKQDRAGQLIDKNEKKRLEKERLKREKEAEKLKEKQRQQEEKRKKAEQKSAEKEKSKSEKKIKVPKRLSSLFHKKDKQAKPVVQIDVDAEASKTDSPQQDPEAEKHEASLADPSVPQQLETMVCPVEEVQTTVEKDTGAIPNSSLSVDVSVEPLVLAASSEKTELSSNSQPAEEHISSTPPHSPLESPTSEAQTPGSDTSEPGSPGSDGEINGSSGGSSVLKKISLGPRLRTAILRKKSSGASDSGAERIPLTTPRSVAESGEMTPPPRKLRPRKPVEQYSPVTPGAHNPALAVAVVDNDDVKDDTLAAVDGGIKTDTAVEDVCVKVNAIANNTSFEAITLAENKLLNSNSEVESDSAKDSIEDTNLTCKVNDKTESLPLAEETIIVKETVKRDNPLDVISKVLTLSPKRVSESEGLSSNQTVNHEDIPAATVSQTEVLKSPAVSNASCVVEEEVLQASTNHSVSSNILSFHAKASDFLRDSESATKAGSDTDDTDPSQLRLQMPSVQEQQLQQHEESSESDTRSAKSPTVISTASIVLRPASVDDTCPDADAALDHVTKSTEDSDSTPTTNSLVEGFSNVPGLDDSLSGVKDDIVNLLPESVCSPFAKDVSKTLSRQEDTGEVCHVVESVSVPHVNDPLPVEEPAETKEAADENISVIDAVQEGIQTKQMTKEEVREAAPQSQPKYTAVCAAQVFDTATEEIDTSTKESTTAARTTRTIAEYQIGTFEESVQDKMAASEEKDDTKLDASFIPEALGELAAETMVRNDETQSANVTITANDSIGADGVWDTSSSLSHSRDESDSGESGEHTPTPSQQDTVASVVNGIVNDALNGVLQGKRTKEDNGDDAKQSENSPTLTPTAENKANDGRDFSFDRNVVEETSLIADENKHAEDEEESGDKTKDINSKPSATDTIEAYLKLQSQEGGESIGSPFVNGDKGFEENGNILMTSPVTAEVVVPAPDEQHVTG